MTVAATGGRGGSRPGRAGPTGDREAFTVLVHQASDVLYAVAYRILRDSGRAEDALQNALVLAWKRLPHLRDADRFEAWIHRILVHACYDESQRTQSWQTNVRMLPSGGPSSPDETNAVADRDELERAYRRLSVEQRAVFVLHHYVGLPLVEVADVLGIPAGTARSRLHYAIAGLRDALTADVGARGPGRATRMTDDRSIERAARSWLEDGPTQAPDHAVEAALLTIQSTTQERDWLPWRIRPMTQTLRLLAGAAALAALVVGGVFILKPGTDTGTGVGSQQSAAPTVSAPSASVPTVSGPSASALPIACSLLSNEEADSAAEFPGVGGVTKVVAAGRDGTTCTFLAAGINPIMDITYTSPGGQVAFESAKRAPGVEVMGDFGTDAIWDPATGTLSLAKGDVLVTIATRNPSPSPRAPIVAIGQLIAGRM